MENSLLYFISFFLYFVAVFILYAPLWYSGSNETNV